MRPEDRSPPNWCNSFTISHHLDGDPHVYILHFCIYIAACLQFTVNCTVKHFIFLDHFWTITALFPIPLTWSDWFSRWSQIEIEEMKGHGDQDLLGWLIGDQDLVDWWPPDICMRGVQLSMGWQAEAETQLPCCRIVTDQWPVNSVCKYIHAYISLGKQRQRQRQSQGPLGWQCEYMYVLTYMSTCVNIHMPTFRLASGGRGRVKVQSCLAAKLSLTTPLGWQCEYTYMYLHT